MQKEVRYFNRPKSYNSYYWYKITIKHYYTGGYIFFETSLLAAPVLRVDDITIREGQNAFIESPVLGSTGAEGKCISFR